VDYPFGTMRVAVSDEDPEAAFERSVVIPETRRLYGLALVIVADRREAADAVQETLLSAWRHWSSLRYPATQSAWLTRICVRRCIRHRRLLSRRVFWSTAQWDQTPGPAPIEFEGRLLDVHRAISALSPPQRAMVALHLQRPASVPATAGLSASRTTPVATPSRR
jgi:DNA-directed RNA polymerase specialized sigma24 family protein